MSHNVTPISHRVQMPHANAREGSRPSTPVGGAIEKLGKELNKGLLNLMNDLKTPRASAGAPSAHASLMTSSSIQRRNSGGGLHTGGANRDLATVSMPVAAQRTLGAVAVAKAAEPASTDGLDFDAQLAHLEAAAGPLPPVSHPHLFLDFIISISNWSLRLEKLINGSYVNLLTALI